MGLVIKCLVLIHFHQSCGGLDLEGADIFVIQCPSHDLPLAEKCNVLCLSVQLGEGARIPLLYMLCHDFYV